MSKFGNSERKKQTCDIFEDSCQSKLKLLGLDEEMCCRMDNLRWMADFLVSSAYTQQFCLAE